MNVASRLASIEHRVTRSRPVPIDLARLDDDQRQRLDELTAGVPGWDCGRPDFSHASEDELMELERLLSSARSM